MCCLIVNNCLSSETRSFLKEQYIVNQSNYANTVVEAVAMITSFGNDDTGGGRGNNKITDKIPEAIVSIHLANCGDDCFNDNDGSIASFESTINDQRTTDDNDLPDVVAPVLNSEFGNDNINENVETNDDGDGGDDNDNDDATTMSGNNKVENSEEEDSVPNNDNINSTNPIDEDLAWMSLLVVADDDDDDDPGDYDERL